MPVRRFFHLSVLLLLALVACSSAAGGAPQAVQEYLQALVSQDTNRLVARSCAEWESQARQELESFVAVKARLEQLSCQVGEKEGSYTLVTCSGKIVANYNGEDQEIKLSDRTYRAIQEGSEWRMCGYR